MANHEITTTATPTGSGALTAANRQAARDLVREGTPASTRRAREGARAYFAAWAEAFGLAIDLPVHSDVVVRFVTEHVRGLPADVDEQLVAIGAKAKLGPHSVATVEARVSHLAMMHKTAGLPNPCADPRVTEVMKAAQKIRGGRRGGRTKKAAATLERLSSMLGTCDDSLAGIRNRALLLVAFASGGRRRSEIVAARVEDLREVDGEYVLTVRHSKTDQEGEGLEVPVTGRAADALAR